MPEPLDPSALRPSSRLQGFQSLMPFRVREVLLVASRYDSFILEEEGQITDLILHEYDRLNLRYAPRVCSTPSAQRALEMLDSDRRIDLVIVTMHPGEIDPADFARIVRRRRPRVPVVLLGYDNREFQELLESPDARAFDRLFVWTGDARILLAIVSIIEDERNVAHDTQTVGVDVILVVEDSVHFISAFLTILYAELMKQSQRLISEGITIRHKVLRMRARPKVLLASSLEEAWDLYEKYRRNLLGIISDVRFRSGGEPDARAGVKLTRQVRADNPDVPIVLQSSDPAVADLIKPLDVAFIDKNSPHWRQSLEEFMLTAFGFGPFIFRGADGQEVARADNLHELRECLTHVPADALRYHSEHNHFSAWLKARSEFRLAARLRPRRMSDYGGAEQMRQMIIDELDAYQREVYRDSIAEFSPDSFGVLNDFARIGGGSLGGKARGLAFLNMLLRENTIGASCPDVTVVVPPTVVIGTEVFDQFLQENHLAERITEAESDECIRQLFLQGKLSRHVRGQLLSLVRIARYPFAVRSSSLLEDSQHQPFAGVYETYMLPNCERTDKQRLESLMTAIKLVYASTFSSKARGYLQATPQRPEKEKMAVIIQQLIGRPHDGRFYPHFSGVAQSYNYYPFGRVETSDGAAAVALGLGEMVVSGRGGMRFCPKYPRHLPEFSTVDDILSNAQRMFHALPMESDLDDPHQRFQPVPYQIDAAVHDGTLGMLGSIYSRENHAVYDGLARDGMPLVTFSGILKHGLFPLPELLIELLETGARAMSAPVELEFAVDLGAEREDQRTFACLQMRPLSVMRDLSRVDLAAVDRSRCVCRSSRALGHGWIRGIQDIVCVPPRLFDRAHSAEAAASVSEFDARLRRQRRPYLLIGPGRWGSADPWLGIPVRWAQIAGARVIVETSFRGVSVAPSEGSHFFHNIVAFHVGYLTMNPDRDDGFIDWEWLLQQPVVEHGENGVRWVRASRELEVVIDGEARAGVVMRDTNGRHTRRGGV